MIACVKFYGAVDVLQAEDCFSTRPIICTYKENCERQRASRISSFLSTLAIVGALNPWSCREKILCLEYIDSTIFDPSDHKLYDALNRVVYP